MTRPENYAAKGAPDFGPEGMRRERRSPLYIGIVKRYGEDAGSLINRQKDAIITLMNSDPTGRGKIVLFVDNPIGNREYANLVNYYTSRARSLVNGKILADFAIHNLFGDNRTKARMTQIGETKRQEIRELQSSNQSPEDREQEEFIDLAIQTHPDRFKVVMGWGDPNVARFVNNLPRDNAALYIDNTFTDKSIARRKEQTESEAHQRMQLDRHDATWIKEALDDPDVIAGIQVIPIMRQGIILAVGGEDETVLLHPGESFEHNSGRQLFIDPGVVGDELVLRSMFNVGGPVGSGEITLVDVAATMYAEQSSHPVKTLEEEVRIGYDVEQGIQQLEGLLEKKAKPEDMTSEERADALKDQIISAFLEENGIWDPRSEEKEKYGNRVNFWISKFQMLWGQEFVVRYNAYIMEHGNTEQIRAIRHAEKETKQTLATVMGRKSEDYGNIELQTAGAEFFLATIKDPEAVYLRMLQYAGQNGGKAAAEIVHYVETYKKVAGEALRGVDPSELRQKPPEFTKDQTEVFRQRKEVRDKRIRYATATCLKSKGIDKPTTESVDQTDSFMRRHIDTARGFIEKYIQLKRKALEEKGMPTAKAQFESEQSILKLLNTVCDEEVEDIDLMDISYALEILLNPSQVGQRLLEAKKREKGTSLENILEGHGLGLMSSK